MIVFPTRTGKLGWIWIVGGFCLLAAFGIASVSIHLTPASFAGAGSKISRWFAQAFAKVDVAAIPTLGLHLLETLAMAIVASVLAAPISVPFAFVASKRTDPWPPLGALLSGVFAILRTIPDLVYAIAFVSAFGLGPVAGVAAMTITTVAFLVKFHYESLDVAPRAPEMGVEAHGGGWWAVRLYGVVPSAKPHWVSQWVYSVDSNVRSASILGFVGAGGIGFEFADSVRLLRYDRLLPILFGIFLIVAMLDAVSEWIRWRTES